MLKDLQYLASYIVIMGTLLEIKKQASSFLQNKYKSARLVLTDVTPAELLAEEATNNDPWGPDARTMTMIAEASFDIDDYWRIVDLLHKRLYTIDWKEWRILYKSLVLLDFLLTRGPEEFAQEFQCDIDVVEELATFNHIDEKGFNWGINMQKKSQRVQQLLKGGLPLKEARLKALKITKEIQGFGSSPTSPSSSSSSPFTESIGSSSFGSYSTNSSPKCNDYMNEFAKQGNSPTKRNNAKYEKLTTTPGTTQDWTGFKTVHENGSLLDFEDDGGQAKQDRTTIKSFSDVGKLMKKKFERQFSIGY